MADETENTIVRFDGTINVSTDVAYSAQPTPELRWKDGVLEQAWEVMEYSSMAGVVWNVTKEWRPIPTEP